MVRQVRTLGCFALCASVAVTLAGCTMQDSAPPPVELAHADLVATSGKPAGRAVVTAVGESVSLVIQARGLTAGMHGLHLHMVGQCAGAAFTSAGGHLNPGMHQHGTMNPAGAHLGDLPNLKIARDGAGALTVAMPGRWSDLEPVLFDGDGTALVIHAGPDDYRTDPSGNSGGRVACGTLARP